MRKGPGLWNASKFIIHRGYKTLQVQLTNYMSENHNDLSLKVNRVGLYVLTTLACQRGKGVAAFRDIKYLY